MMACLESSFLCCLWVDSFPGALVLQYLCVFLSSITIQLQLCTAPLQTLALGFDSPHFCLGAGMEDKTAVY